MASYPTGIKSFTAKAAGQTIDPAHPNDIQDEVTAIETGLLSGVAHLLTLNAGLTVSTGSVNVGGPSSVTTLQVNSGSTFAGPVTFSTLVTFSTAQTFGGVSKPFQVFTPLSNQPSSVNYATYAVRNAHPVLDFDASSRETAIFGSVLPVGYSANGLTVDLYWVASTATSGAVVWDVAIEHIEQSVLDIDVDSFAPDITSSAHTTPGTCGVLAKTAVAFANGSTSLDSLVGGAAYRLRVARNSTAGADTMLGDAELLRVVVRET